MTLQLEMSAARRAFRQNLTRASILEVELLVDTELATLMLRQNRQNRPSKRADILFLAQEINAGRWATLADGVAFDRKGILVDGQHRLFAIIETGKSVKMRVTFGLDPAVRVAVDVRGRVGDGALLEAAGLDCGDMRAAVARVYLIHALQSDHRRFAFADIEATARQISPQLDLLAQHIGSLNRLGIRAPLLGALVVGLRKDEVSVRDFVDRLINFRRDGANDPVVRFEKLAGYVKGRTRDDLFNAGLRCLRAHMTGNKLERVRTTDDELSFFNIAA